MANTSNWLKCAAAAGLFVTFGVAQAAVPTPVAHADCVGGFEQGGYDPTTCAPTQDPALTPSPEAGSALSACEQAQTPSGYGNAGSDSVNQGIYNCPGAPADTAPSP